MDGSTSIGRPTPVVDQTVTTGSAASGSLTEPMSATSNPPQAASMLPVPPMWSSSIMLPAPVSPPLPASDMLYNHTIVLQESPRVQLSWSLTPDRLFGEMTIDRRAWYGWHRNPQSPSAISSLIRNADKSTCINVQARAMLTI